MARPLAARWSRRALVGAFSALLALPGLAGTGAVASKGGAPALADVNSNFELVGHNPLGNRGMNAAIAVHGNYAYIGSRTDGKANNANHAGIMVVDISNPTTPTTVREIGPPLEANPGESSRELRIWKSQDILIVLHTNCGEIHVCGGRPSVNFFRFYDISGANASDPKKIVDLNMNTHEFFLWEDPFDPNFALMFGGSAGTSMQVWDISPVRDGQVPTTVFNSSSSYTGGLHSLSVSNDGTRAYFALLTGGFAVADVSDFTHRVPSPAIRRVTLSNARPTWPGPGAHSAVKLWNQDYVYVADEVYGEAAKALGAHGCPWGWARMIDISDPTRPVVRAEYKLPQNEASFCTTDVPRPSSSYSAHNPTVTPHLVITSWHSGGVQVVDVSNPAAPVKAGEFVPGLDQRPAAVVQEDPLLSAGQDKVAMWSYPIIRDGLIYLTDIRNGLYILRYTGPHAAEVSEVDFLEGNSNLGDALLFEPVDPCSPLNPTPPDTCP